MLSGVRKKERELQEAARRARAQAEQQSESATETAGTSAPPQTPSLSSRFLPAFLTRRYGMSDTADTQAAMRPQRPTPPAGLFEEASRAESGEPLAEEKEDLFFPVKKQSEQDRMKSREWSGGALAGDGGVARTPGVPGEPIRDYWGDDYARRIMTAVRMGWRRCSDCLGSGVEKNSSNAPSAVCINRVKATCSWRHGKA